LVRCRAEASGNNGFYQAGTNGKVTDLFLDHCIVYGTGTQGGAHAYSGGTYHGFWIEDGAGTFLMRCHTYNTDGKSIYMQNGWAARVESCYVDGIGPSSGFSGPYQGIHVQVKGATAGNIRGTVVAHNIVGDGTATSGPGPISGQIYYYFHVEGVQSGNSYVSLLGNIATGASTTTGTPGSTGFYLHESAGGTLNVYRAANGGGG
jgi:hypothetical protein